MFASTLRNAARTSSRPLRRTVSDQSRLSSTSGPTSSENSSSSSSSSQVYLNPERKRKLVSLYHQAERFVTHENLSDYIDHEFQQNFVGDRSLERIEDGKGDLVFALAESRAHPKMVTSSAAEGEGILFRRAEKYATTSLKKKAQAKERRLLAAVYGVDDSFKASLEMVEERKRNLPDLSDE